MFQPKARRVFPVLALTAALSLVPLARASAAEIPTVQQSPSVLQLLASQLEAGIVSLWTSIETALRGDAGPRMDDNGGS